MTIIATSHTANMVNFYSDDLKQLLGSIELPRPTGVSWHRNLLTIGAWNGLHQYLWQDGQLYPILHKPLAHADFHTIRHGRDGQLWGLHTSMNALCTYDRAHQEHFTVQWMPPFIDTLTLEDRCHVNGFAMRNGRPRYVSMLSQTNSNEGWKREPNGTIIDMLCNEVVVDGLDFPHSPTWHNETLYFLQSRVGLCRYDNGQLQEIVHFKHGYLRGLAIVDNVALIGYSADRSSGRQNCGLIVYDLATQNTAVKRLGRNQEIFEVMYWPLRLEKVHSLTTGNFIIGGNNVNRD